MVMFLLIPQVEKLGNTLGTCNERREIKGVKCDMRQKGRDSECVVGMALAR